MSKTPVQRDKRGRWLPGTSGGPGRKPRQREVDFQAAFRKACGPTELAAVVRTVVKLAKSGELPACRLLLDFALEKPRERLEIESTNAEEFRVAGITPSELDKQMLARLAAAVAARQARAITLEQHQAASGHRLIENQKVGKVADTKAPAGSDGVVAIPPSVT